MNNEFAQPQSPQLPEPPPPKPPVHRTWTPNWRAIPWTGLFWFLVIVSIPVWVWTHWRIEPGPGQVAVLIRKTGRPLPSGQVLATEPGYKGIQLEVLPEGRYFRNPYVWSWEYHPVVTIGAGRLGVQVRLYGEPTPPGQILAGPGQKGILPEILGPGTYRINPYAVSVHEFDAVNIRPGHVGVVVSLVGMDPLEGRVPAECVNTFLVSNSCKGVQPWVLPPGTHYLNPYMFHVTEVSLQSQQFQMSGDDAISFLTSDGFTVEVEGTLEFALERDKVALLTHRVGDMEDVIKKIILPRARGFSRIEASKQPATAFIMGETRQQFQNTLETHLREQCAPWGVTIKSVLIRNIKVPNEIASVIRDREIAVQEARKFDQEIEQARSKAELTRQETLALQNKAKVEADTAKIKAVIAAQQTQAVQVTNALRSLEVARVELESAQYQARAILVNATGQMHVVRVQNDAEAAVLAAKARAMKDGAALARLTFLEKIAPQVDSILTTDDSDGLGSLLRVLLGPSQGIAPPARPPAQNSNAEGRP